MGVGLRVGVGLTCCPCARDDSIHSLLPHGLPRYPVMTWLGFGFGFGFGFRVGLVLGLGLGSRLG